MSDSKYIPLQEATKFCNYSQEYLSLRARQGKLKAMKFGRNWVTKYEWLEEYLGQVEEYNNGNDNLENKKLGQVPDNLPIELVGWGKISFGRLRVGFLAALVVSLLLNNIAFGKENLKNVFNEADNYVGELNVLSDKFLADSGESFKNVFGSLDSFAARFGDKADSSFAESDRSLKNVFRDFSSFANNFGESFDKDIAGSFENWKLEIGNLAQRASGYTYILGGKADNFLTDSVRSFANVYQDVKKINLGAAEIGDAAGNKAGKNLRDYFSWLKQGYIFANDIVEQKLKNFAIGIKDSYLAANDFVEQKITDVKNQVSNFGKLVSAPWSKILPEKVLESGNFATKEEQDALEKEVSDLKQKGLVAKEITREVQRITQIEPVKEITRETVRFDELALGQVRAQIVDLQDAVAKRLYAPGGVISQQIYLTQPVSSSKVYQENGDIVYQTVGTGNVILSAATGMQISGKLVVIDSTAVANPLVYIADKTEINGDTSIGGAVTAQKIILSGGDSGANILDVKYLGSSKFSVDNTGATLVGNFTMTGNLSVTGSQSFNGTVAITVSTSSTALTVSQSGTGNIVDFQDAGVSVFKIADGGYATLAVSASTTPAFIIRTPDATSTFATSTYLGVLATSTFVGRFADFVKSGTGSMFYLDNSGNLMATGTLAIGATTTLATNGGFVGIATSSPSGTEKLTIFGNVYGSGNMILAGSSGSTTIASHFAALATTTLGSATSTPTIFTGYVQSNIYPFSNLTYDLGSSTQKWRNLYVGTTTIGSTITIGSADISASGALSIRSAGDLTASSTNDLIFTTAGSERMRIDDATGYVSLGTTTFTGLFNIATSTNILNVLTSGFVGIGTAAPSVKLDISSGNIRLSDSQNIQWGGATNFITGSNASNYLAFNTNNTERIRVDSSGNVGLGTTSPASLLEIWNATSSVNMTASSSQLTITMATSGTAYDPQIVFRTGSGVPTSRFTLGVDYSASNNFVIATSTLGANNLLSINYSSTSVSIATDTYPGLFNIATSTSILTVLPSGNVGIGNTSPSTKLDISSGNIRLSDSQNIQWGGATNFITGSNASNFLAFNTNNSERIRVDSSGNVGIGTSTPSELLTVWGGISVATSSSFQTFYVASTTGRVGVGTSSPATLFSVATSTNIFNVNLAGLSGFGTSSPTEILTVKASGPSAALGIYASNSTPIIYTTSAGFVGIGTTGPGVQLDLAGIAEGATSIRTTGELSIGSTNAITLSGSSGITINDVNLKRSAANTLTLASGDSFIVVSGNVGIGTTTPSEMLTVWGGISVATSSSFQTFYVASTTGRVGVGTSSPATLFSVATSTNIFNINLAGLSGFGTSSPTEVLSVKASGPSAALGIYASNSTPIIYTTSGGNVGIGIAAPTYKLQVSDNNSTGVVGLHISSGDGGFYLETDDNNTYLDAGRNGRDLTILSTGLVGIGTTTPSELLTVWGGISVATSSSFQTFYVASTTGRVGVGTSSPATLFSVATSTNIFNINLAGLSGFGTSSPTEVLSVKASGPSAALGIYASNSTPIIYTSAAGFVGIGTTEPLGKLQVSGNVYVVGSGYLRVGNNGAANIILDSAGSNYAKIQNDAADKWSLGYGNSVDTTLGTPVLTWTSGGLVGIGTTTPSEMLTVWGGAYFGTTSATPTFYIASSTGRVAIGTSTTNGIFYVATSTPMFTILQNGNIGIGTTSPAQLLALEKNQNAQTIARITNGTSGTGAGSQFVVSYTTGQYAAFMQANPSYTTDGLIVANSASLWTNGNTSGLRIFTYDATDLTFGTNNAANMTIKSGGLVGIGTTTPAEVLTIRASSTYPGLGVYASNSTPIIYTTSAGNVGIGTTAPNGKLQVLGGTSNFYGSGGRSVGWGDTSSLGVLSFSGSNPTIGAASGDFYLFVDNDGANPKMVIKSTTGNVGIGTTTPQALAHIWGNAATSTLTVQQTGSGNIVDFIATTTSVFTLKNIDHLEYRDGLTTTWGDFNDVVLEDAEDNNLSDWKSSDTTNSTTTGSATTTNFKVGDFALGLTTVVNSSKGDSASTTNLATANWSSYERLGFWLMAVYNSTSSLEASTTQKIINFQFKDSGESRPFDATSTIKEIGKWQYEEVAINATGSTGLDTISWYGFRIENDYGSPIFYIDQIRLYDTDERTSEIFVDSSGGLNIVSPTRIDLTRGTPGSGSRPGLSVDAAVVEINQPLSVNVGGDVGLDYDLVFMNTGASNITSEGPLTIRAGDANHYENLTLGTGGKGDIIMDISTSTIGLKIMGNATSSFGAYMFLMATSGQMEIGNNLTISGDIIPATTTSGTSTYRLGTKGSAWAFLYASTTVVGDIIFANQFSIIEASVLGVNPPEALIFKNASGTDIMKIDENGNLTVDTIKTRQLCVGDTCVTEAEFRAVFDPASSTPTSTPETIIDSGPSGVSTTSLEATFVFHSEQNGTTTTDSTFQCKVNLLDWAGCTSPKNYPGLTVGDYTFQVYATDPLGNYDHSPASSTWSIVP